MNPPPRPQPPPNPKTLHLRPQYLRQPDWATALKIAGYPTRVLVIDFETYFDTEISMRKMSTVEYINHQESEVLGCSFLDSDSPQAVWVGPDELPSVLRQWSDTEGVTWAAQNAAFDFKILAELYGLHPTHFVDLLGLARAWDARADNSLEALAKREGLEAKGDTNEFKECSHRVRWTAPKRYRGKLKPPIMRPVMDAAQYQNLIDYANQDAKLEWELLQRFLPRLSNPARELPLIQQTVELYTKPTLHVDYVMGEDLATEMDRMVDDGIREANERLDELAEATDLEIPLPLDKTWLNSNKGFPDLVIARIREIGEDPFPYCKEAKDGKDKETGRQKWRTTLAMAKQDEAREQLINHPDPIVKALMGARVAMKSWPQHSARVRSIMAQAKAGNDLLGVPLKYHGAHTGRDAGGEKINLQNLGSRGHELVSRVRNLLHAPENHTLVIADAAQIEARVVAWFAGQDDLLQKFRDNEEIYCGFAELVLNQSVVKPNADTMTEEEFAFHKWARNSVGKVGILGAGYGMGGDKAEAYAQGALDNETAHRLIKTYRATYPMIPKFWRWIERQFFNCARTRRPIESAKLTFIPLKNDGVTVRLPNGRELNYPKVRAEVEFGDDGREFRKLYLQHPNSKSWGSLWGGVLTENVVQATARDVVFEAGTYLDGVAGRLVHRVHDEIILSVPEDQAQRSLALAIQRMSTPPVWAPDLPCAAEGVVSKTYGDH